YWGSDTIANSRRTAPQRDLRTRRTRSEDDSRGAHARGAFAAPDAAQVRGDPRERLDRHRLHARPALRARQPALRGDGRLAARNLVRPTRLRGLADAPGVRGDRRLRRSAA